MHMSKYWDMFVKFIKFNIVGVMNTALDLGIFALLTWIGVGEGLAKTVSYSCGVLNSYFWNSRWTFKQEHKKSPGSSCCSCSSISSPMRWRGLCCREA